MNLLPELLTIELNLLQAVMQILGLSDELLLGNLTLLVLTSMYHGREIIPAQILGLGVAQTFILILQFVLTGLYALTLLLQVSRFRLNGGYLTTGLSCAFIQFCQGFGVASSNRVPTLLALSAIR